MTSIGIINNMPSDASLQQYAPRIQLLFEDVCPVIASGDLTDCENFGRKILTQGLDPSIGALISSHKTFAINLHQSINNQNFSFVNQTLTSPDFSFIETLSETYMQPALIVFQQQYSDEISSGINSFNNILQILLAVFICLLVVLYMFIYRPMVNQLDMQLKRTRGMLLMIPIDVIENHPSLRKTFLQNQI